MIDLTPLDVRSKRGDFKRVMRGYDPQEVDVFLEIAAERLEVLVRENMTLKERTRSLQEQVSTQGEREKAVQAALVTAQELRADIQGQAQREAENVLKAAETESRRLIAEAEAEVRTRLRGSERNLDHLEDAIKEMERRRTRFLKDFRQLLQRELDVVEVEEGRAPLEDRTIDMELGTRRPPDVVGAPRIVRDTPSGGSPHAEPAAPQEPAPPKEHVPREDVVVGELAPTLELDEDEGETEVATVLEPEEAPRDEPKGRERPPSTRRPDNLLLYFDTDGRDSQG